MSSSDSLNAHVAGEIRAELARRRMTARELADRLNVKRMWVQYRLTETTPIHLDDLQRIADALELDLRDLLPARTRGGGTTNARYRQTAVTAPGYADPTLTDRPPTYRLNDRSPAVADTRRTRRPVVVDTQPWDSAQ